MENCMVIAKVNWVGAAAVPKRHERSSVFATKPIVRG